ncbi:VPLPA-CTERM sorting domain-containing protein [uncultured Albimonas sp.]|uniref:VPLPA-CTERM sorting domain-containing protein n=1 Tax=uncultured Albimonas sp. TaxID=1331701 RepID=UPI0030EC09F8|tara:strand:+ start:592 stop:1185 length:594 start_codon:yes stop_codon:yes gene_type:complete
MKTLIFAAAAASLAAPALALPVQWEVADGGNGHWYELVESSQVWSGARDLAAGMTHLGMTGYLATITSQEEQDFLSAEVNPDGLEAFLGGSDAEVEGEWRWVAGPEAGTLFWVGAAAGTAFGFEDWHSGEPNDSTGEDNLLGWSFDSNDWMDLRSDAVRGAYLVEYSGASPVPIPAAGGLLAAGVGALSLLRRRRRA